MSTCVSESFVRKNDLLDPVHRHDDGTWWFCDEVWAECVGPYTTEEECRNKLKEYAASL